MPFPTLTEAGRIQKLTPPGNRVRVVIDTDTFNQIDDQFAVTYALLSQEKLDVEALYAAPFVRAPRSADPREGMEKSYAEILRLLECLGIPPRGLVYRGSGDYLQDVHRPPPSDAVDDLIRRARQPGDHPLYVAAIGAVTNVASAILQAPDIIARIVVVWMGGHAYAHVKNDEFNLSQDVAAAQLLFDCGVPLVHIPCRGGAETLRVTLPEMEAQVKGRGAIGDYLYELFKDFTGELRDEYKVIWDIAPIAWLIHADWVPTELTPSPILNKDTSWSHDPSRHPIRVAREVNRDAVFEDLFVILEEWVG